MFFLLAFNHLKNNYCVFVISKLVLYIYRGSESTMLRHRGSNQTRSFCRYKQLS